MQTLFFLSCSIRLNYDLQNHLRSHHREEYNSVFGDIKSDQAKISDFCKHSLPTTKLRYRFNATSQFRACASARTREPERHHTRVRALPHSSSSSTTRELEWYHTGVRVESTYCYTQCHSPRANTGSAFFRFSQLTTYTIESIAVITYAIDILSRISMHMRIATWVYR